MMKNRYLVKFDYFFLGLFSIVLALGTWNPFDPYAFEEDDASNLFSQIFISAFVFYLVISSVLRGSITRVSKANKCLIVFGIILSMTTFFYSSQGNLFSPQMILIKFGMEIVMVIFLADFFEKNPHYIDYSLLFYVIVCAIISVLFIRGFLDQFVVMRSGRMLIFGENPNSTSGRIVAAAVALLYLLMQNPLKWNRFRLVFSFLFIPLLAMIVSSGSRGSIIIMAVCAILYILIGNFKRSNKILLIVGTGGILLFFYIYYYQGVSEELSVIDRFIALTEGDDAGRAKLNEETMAIFNDNPITGYGLSGYRNEMFYRYNEFRVAHNLYYYVLGVSGLAGAIPFFAFLYFNLKNSFLIRKKQSLSLVLLTFNLLLIAKTGGVLTYALTWYIFAIISAQTSICGRK